MKRRPAKSRRRRLKGPIHDRISSLRDLRGWSQQELADKLGVDKTAVSHWENGIACPDLGRLKDIANVLGTSFDVLLKDLLSRDEAA